MNGRKEGNVLFNDDSTHFVYGYMASEESDKDTEYSTTTSNCVDDRYTGFG